MDVPRCECCGATAEPDPTGENETLLCDPCASFECEQCATTRVIETRDGDEVCFEDLDGTGADEG